MQKTIELILVHLEEAEFAAISVKTIRTATMKARLIANLQAALVMAKSI